MDGSSNGIRFEARPTCYLCNSAGKSLYSGLQDHLFGIGGSWSLKQCPRRDCGLAWLDPMPIAGDIAKLYEKYLTHTLPTETMPPERQSSVACNRTTRRSVASEFGYSNLSPRLWSALIAHLNANACMQKKRKDSRIAKLHGFESGRLIDIGCGNGKFLARMRALGWEVIGIEPDQKAAQIGRESYGVTIYSGILEDYDFLADSFDVVTMSHVIEHLTDPLSTLKTARQILKKGGYLLISTPNLSSLGHRWFRHHWRGLEPPRHLFLFSPKALLRIIAAAGFEVFDLQTIFANSIWYESSALKHGINLQNIPARYARLSGYLYMAVQRYITGWPLYRPWGEQLTLVAAKR